ncbi:hypothetical protein [Cohnella sp. JJ-181]|uniref:hypothetical protein n=1 Tax=Cohnella rhizoplanae TaxID=2974897 RepID=UPI0022FFB985|nr:hypothetical protein [Cohnella sp. JJ-181]CAI6079587.1 hypothetical protein COHCIP112018_02794 [Cohnella sp. JJ-181]
MYRELRAIGIALLGFMVTGSVGLSAGSAHAASTGKGTAKATATVSASFQDRDAQAGEIGGIIYISESGASAAKIYEAYLLDDKGKRYGKAIGKYAAERHSFVIPEDTKVTARAAALGVFNASDSGKSAAVPVAKASLRDYPAYLVGGLTYSDADPAAGASGSIGWTDPADGTDYDGYQIEYPGGKEKVAKSSTGRYKLALRDLDILGEVSVVPYREGGIFEYSASARVQSYDDIRNEEASWVVPGDVNSTSAPVSDIHFKPVLSGGKTRVSGELSWYDADSSTTVNYVVYGADADGVPIQPIADVTNDYPFDGKAYRLALPEFPLKDVSSIAIYAVRDGGTSAAVYIPVGGDPDPLFADTDAAKGKIGGTVYVKPRFPDYGAALFFVDEWQQPIGAAIDVVEGESRYFEIPADTAVPAGAWRLAIYDNGGLAGSEFEKLPQYIAFKDE